MSEPRKINRPRRLRHRWQFPLCGLACPWRKLIAVDRYQQHESYRAAFIAGDIGRILATLKIP